MTLNGLDSEKTEYAMPDNKEEIDEMGIDELTENILLLKKVIVEVKDYLDVAKTHLQVLIGQRDSKIYVSYWDGNPKKETKSSVTTS